MKVRACKRVGITSEKIVLPESITEEALLAEVDRLNKDATIDGILVQVRGVCVCVECALSVSVLLSGHCACMLCCLARGYGCRAQSEKCQPHGRTKDNDPSQRRPILYLDSDAD